MTPFLLSLTAINRSFAAKSFLLLGLVVLLASQTHYRAWTEPEAKTALRTKPIATASNTVQTQIKPNDTQKRVSWGGGFLSQLFSKSPHYLKEITQPSQQWAIWPKHHVVLRVFIADGQSLSGYPDHAQTLAETAAKAWEPYFEPQRRIQFVSTPQQADIEVYWSDQPIPSQWAEFANATCQNTSLQWQNPPAELVHSKITIGIINPYTHQPYTKQQLSQLIQHEMGHAIGLPHSPDPANMMFPHLEQLQATAPSVADQNTLQLLYTLESIQPAKTAQTGLNQPSASNTH